MFPTSGPGSTLEEDCFSGVSSIDLAEGSGYEGSENSLDFESTRRPRYTVSTTDSEGSIVMTIVKRKAPDVVDVFEPAQLTKRRRLMEADGLETSDCDFTFSAARAGAGRGRGRAGAGRASRRGQASRTTAPRRAAWVCHACQLSAPGPRVRCGCRKMIHKLCKSYGLCAPA